MRKEEFSFGSRDGVTDLHAVMWVPKQENPLCILQIIHGMNEYIERYDAFASYLAERGVLVVGDDHLGHGKSVPEGGTYGYFCENDPATVLVRDEHRLKKLVESKYPKTPYLILGHSMGSFILRNYITRYGSGIDGAIICGTGTPAEKELIAGSVVTWILGKLCGPRYVSRFVYQMTNRAYMDGKGKNCSEFDWICSDPDVVKAYEKDPLCGGFTFTVSAYHTLYELARRMKKKENMDKIPKKLPVLIVSGAEDPVGEKGVAPKQLYDAYLNMDMTKVSLKLYNGARHEILNEKIKETIYEELYSWVEMIAVQGK